MKTLYKASQGYSEWKKQHGPGYKPWIYPEQIDLPKLIIEPVWVIIFKAKIVFINDGFELQVGYETGKNSWNEDKDTKLAMQIKM